MRVFKILILFFLIVPVVSYSCEDAGRDSTRSLADAQGDAALIRGEDGAIQRPGTGSER